MKVAVLGGSGRAGSEIVMELARRKHTVLALARRPEEIVITDGVRAVAGDASDPEKMSDLIRGSDAVISALHFDVPADTLLSAVRRSGVRRLLVTGGAASLRLPSGQRVIDAPDFPGDWKPLALKGIAFLDELKREKSIDWTFFSPAALFFVGPRLGRYRLGGDELVVDGAGESKISFADYASAMVDELQQRRHSRARFTAAY